MYDSISISQTGALKIHGTIFIGRNPEVIDYLIPRGDPLYAELLESFEIKAPAIGQELGECSPRTAVWNIVIGNAHFRSNGFCQIRCQIGKVEGDAYSWSLNIDENSEFLKDIFGKIETETLRPVLSSRIAGIISMDESENLDVFIRRQFARTESVVPKSISYQLSPGSSGYPNHRKYFPDLKPFDVKMISASVFQKIV